MPEYAAAAMNAPRTIVTRARDAGPASNGSPRAVLVLVLGVAGGIVLALAEFTTIASVDVGGGACEVINDANPALADRCELSGFERHGGALLVLGAAAVTMAIGAGRRHSRPAAFALIAISAIVLALAILRDLPETQETGGIGLRYEAASAAAGPGLYLEIGAGLLVAAGGALALARRQ